MLFLERVVERVLLAGWDVVAVMLSSVGFKNVGKEVQQRGRFIGKRMLAA